MASSFSPLFASINPFETDNHETGFSPIETPLDQVRNPNSITPFGGREPVNLSTDITPSLVGDAYSIDPDEASDTMFSSSVGSSHVPSGKHKDALEYKGVQWSDDGHASEAMFPFSSTGFYDLDYDPSGRKAALRELDPNRVHAANVFGREFSRDELLKDSEGRRLLNLMETRRSGDHQRAGFLAGFNPLKNVSMDNPWKIAADIPFLGWMVDAGLSITDTALMSKTMRKMQDGEKVSPHEALMVRRYMLEQEMEQQRSLGYNVGSIIHSSVPFMFEMMASSAMLAASAKAGLAIGRMIGGGAGAAIGGAVGAAGALVFGGVGKLFSYFGRNSAKAAAKFATSRLLSEAAERTFEQGMDRAFRSSVLKELTEVTGRSVKDLYASGFGSVGKAKALVAYAKKMGLSGRTDEDLATAARNFLKTAPAASRAEFAKYRQFEVVKAMAEHGKSVYAGDMDARLAQYMLVNGDVANTFRHGLRQTLEAALEDAAEATVDNKLSPVARYFARKKNLAAGMKKILSGESDISLDEVVESYINGVAKGASTVKDGALDTLPLAGMNSAMRNAFRSMDNMNGAAAVHKSISAALGGTASMSFSKSVAKEMAKDVLEGVKLQHGVGNVFVRNMEQFGRWAADGAANGILRWDTSVFGGLGTIARSGTAMGGKMEALKEALKISFVEAPLRGAMQYGSQIPLWSAVSTLTGNGPGGFVVRGQLGIQAQALQSGDKDMMRHSQAIALGSGLVEYISENAGRGFNVFASGIIKPGFMYLLPEPIQKLGSSMARKIEAIFGSEEMMKDGNRKKLVDAVISRMKQLNVQNKSGLGQIVRGDVEKMVASRTAKGIASMEDALKKLGMNERQLITSSISSAFEMGRIRAGILYFTAFNMMEKGLTPQAFAKVLERVGYDGMISEMAEERYGGFFQGLLGLNERPSDEGLRGRLSAAFEGLFPDKEQLLTEALGFAFPSVAQVSLNRVYSRLGKGITNDIKNAANALNVGKRATPELVLELGSAEYAQKLSEHNDKLRAVKDARFGTVQSNREKVTSQAEALFSRIRAERAKGDADNEFMKDSRLRKFAELDTVDKVAAMLVQTSDGIIRKASDSESMESALSDARADILFGEEGTEAVRNLKRLSDSRYSDDATTDFYKDGGEYSKLINETPLPSMTDAVSVDDVVNEITAALPIVSSDETSVEALRRYASDASTGVRVDQYQTDVVGNMVENMKTIADAGMKMKFNTNGGESGHWFRKGLMRLVGVIDAITTGDLSLAANNPVQWALADANVPRDMLETLVHMKELAIRRGAMDMIASGESSEILEYLNKDARASVEPLVRSVNEASDQLTALVQAGASRSVITEAHESVEAAKEALASALKDVQNDIMSVMDIASYSGLMEKFESAGDQYFVESLRQYASTYLLARNVMSVSKADISDAAYRVIAYERMKAGKLSSDTATTSDAFRNTVSAGDLEAAKDRIVSAVVKMASDKVISINQHGRFGREDTMDVAFDYRRAMRYGTEAEVVAAIKAMPAFRGLRTVHDLSNGRSLDPMYFDTMARSVDVGRILDINPDEDISPEDLSVVTQAMGREHTILMPPEDMQAAAKRFVRQLRLQVESKLPTRHTDSDGTDITVTYSNIIDETTGERRVVASFQREDDLHPSAVEGSTVAECVSELKSVHGITADVDQVILCEGFTLASSDATSLAVFALGRENARRLFVERLGLVDNFDERLLPPVLRQRSGNWRYSEDEASEVLASELRLANGRGEKDAVREARSRVYGDSESSPGYETVAAAYLKRSGAVYGNNDSSAALLLGGPCYTMWPSQLHIPGKTFITSDYYSTGDTEAMARSVVGEALRSAARDMSIGGSFVRLAGLTRTQYREVRAAIVREFRETAMELATKLDADRPEVAERIRNVVGATGVNVADADNYELLAAIATSTVFFTCDRGLNQEGNGFLYGPELALVADRMRGKKWSGVLMSIVDELFGGSGMFSNRLDGMRGLYRIAEAFSPSGAAIVAARSSSILQIKDENGRPKEDISIPVYSTSSAADSLAAHTTSFKSSVSSDDSDAIRSIGVREILDFAKYSSSELADKLEQLKVKNPTAWVVEHLLNAEHKGGEAKPSISFKGPGSKDVETVGAVNIIKSTSAKAAPRMDGLISDVDALYLARTLMFMSDKAMAIDRAHGSRVALAGRQLAAAMRQHVEDTLLSMGMDPMNVDKVCSMLETAWDNPFDDSDDIIAEFDREDLEEARENGETMESWEDRKKDRAVLDNQDLIAVGRQLRHVFPVEGRNHTAIMFRVATELPQFAQAIKEGSVALNEIDFPEASSYENAVGKSTAQERIQALELVGKLFNTLRSPREGTAAEAIAASGSVWADPEATDRILSDAVMVLRDHGVYDLAFALNALRRITNDKSRRSIALTAIGNMSRSDVHSVNVGIDSHGVVEFTHDKPGTAGGTPLAAVTATISHVIVNCMVPRGHREQTATRVGNVVSYLKTLFAPVDRPNSRHSPADDLAEAASASGVGRFLNVDHDTISDILEESDEQHQRFDDMDSLVDRVFSQVEEADGTTRKFDVRRRPVNEDGTPVPYRLSLHDLEVIRKFAEAYAERMSAVATVVETLFGYGNPLAYALNHPDIVQHVYESLVRTMETADTAASYYATFRSMFVSTVPTSTESANGNGTTYYHLCPFLERSVVNTLSTALFYAPSWRDYRNFKIDENATPEGLADDGLAAEDKTRNVLKFAIENHVTADDMLAVWSESPLRAVASRFDLSGKRLRDEWISGVSGGDQVSAARSQSKLGQVLAHYSEALPRSTAKVGGEVSGGYTDNGQAVCVGPSPSQMEMRLTDGLLSKVKIGGTAVKDQFLADGARFSDGSRLVTVAPGALIGSKLADQEHVSRLVYFANHDDYVVRGNVKSLRFELFHGEKPTVTSVQLPGYVAQKILEDIRNGEEYTVNEVTSLLRDSIPESIEADGPAELRESVYDALFSVVAAQAGCAEIDTKRVQVLLSQGAPFTGFRDTKVDFGQDGGKCQLKPVEITTFDGSRKVVPGVVTTILLSGKDSTQNMGGYLVHGHLSNMHRSLSSGGKDTISEKEHLNDPAAVGLFKGQGHDMNLGMYETDLVPIDGMTRNAQRLLRWSLERTLGIPEGTLDLPTAEHRADPEYMARRERALACVEEYLDVASVVFTDMETVKAGPLSTRCGFAAPKKDSPIKVTFKNHDVTVTFTKDGVVAEVDGGPARSVSGVPLPEYKNGAYSVVTMIPVLMKATGETEVSADDYASIEGTFSLADFTKTDRVSLRDSGVFRDLGTGADGEKSDSLSFRKDGNGYVCQYFSRRFVGQIMANSHDSSHASNHNAAANYIRDVTANFARLKESAMAGLIEPAAITVVSRFLPMAVIRLDPKSVDDQVSDNEDLAPFIESNPNSDSVKEKLYLNKKAAIAKLLKPQITANHAVLCSAGAKAELDMDNNSVSVSWTDGADDYDKDALRPVHVFSTKAAEAFGTNRSYCSGFVNFSEPEDSFRYGWHLDDDAFSAASAEVNTYMSGTEAREAYESCLARMNESIVSVDEATGMPVRTSDGRDNETVAKLAALICEYRRLGSASETGKALRELFGRLFVDYTGKHLSEHDGGISDAVDFSDLFLSDGRFDLAAFECNAWRKAVHAVQDNGSLGVATDSTGSVRKTIYLGGSFFIGDRRPSGNFESAGGLARAQAPVVMEANGKPGKTAMYVLDPATGTVQGSDTDGDSTTCSRLSKSPELVRKARELVRDVMATLSAMARNSAPESETDQQNTKEDDFETMFERIGLFSKRGEAEAEDGNLSKILRNLAPAYPEFFTVRKGTSRINLTRQFSYAMGDLMVNAQVDNYRKMECVRQEQSPDGTFSTGAKEADRLVDEGPDNYVADVGFAGRSPVGPDPVSSIKVPETDFGTRDLYRSITGKSMSDDMKYTKAFKECIDTITDGVLPKVTASSMLRARPSGALSSYAANASGARGVGVSLQAAVEHLVGFSFGEGSEGIRRLAPALFRSNGDRNSPGYRACEDFIGHFDGICNALFDVVKDLFAPRAGWQKSMLNYLMAKLMYDAAKDYLPAKEDGTPDFDATAGFNAGARFDNAWFFKELVEFARDFHRDERSIANLLGKAHAGNNYAETEFYGNEQEKKTLRGMITDSVNNEDSVIHALALKVPSSVTEDDPDGEFDETAGDRGPKDKAEEYLAYVSDPKNALIYENLVLQWKDEVLSMFPKKPSEKAPREVIAAYRRGITAVKELATVNDGLNGVLDDLADELNGTIDDAAEEFVRLLNSAAGMGGMDGLAIGCSVLLDSWPRFISKARVASEARESIQKLNTLLETEDSLSPDSVFQQGGSKALGAVEKSDRSLFDRNRAIRNTSYRVSAIVNTARARDLVSSAHDRNLMVKQLRGNAKGLMAALRIREGGSDNYADMLAKYCRKNGISQVPCAPNELVDLAAVMLREADLMTDADVDRNRRILCHLVGAVRLGAETFLDVTDGDIVEAGKMFVRLYEGMCEIGESGVPVLEEVLSEFVDGAVRGSIVAYDEEGEYDLVENDADIQLLFSMLRISPNGKVTLAAKSGPRDAQAICDAFENMKGNSSVLTKLTLNDGSTVDLRVKDLAAVIRTMICSVSPFDSVQESDLRAEPASMFLKENRITEQWGEAVMKTIVGRALTLVTPLDEGYDLLADNQRVADETSEDYGKIVPSQTDAKRLNKRARMMMGMSLATDVPGITVNWRSRTGRDYQRINPKVMGRISTMTPLDVIMDLVTTDSSVSRVADHSAQGKPFDKIRQRTVVDFYKSGTGLMSFKDMRKTDPKIPAASRYVPTDLGFGLAPRTTSELKFVGSDGKTTYDFFEDAFNADIDAAFRQEFGRLRNYLMARRKEEAEALKERLGTDKLTTEQYDSLELPAVPNNPMNQTAKSMSEWAWYCSNVINLMVGTDSFGMTLNPDGKSVHDWNYASVFICAYGVFKRTLDANSGTAEGLAKMKEFLENLMTSGGPSRADNLDKQVPGQNPVWRKIREAARKVLQRVEKLEKSATQNGGEAKASVSGVSSLAMSDVQVTAMPKRIARRDAFSYAVREDEKSGGDLVSRTFANPENNIRASLEKVFGKWDRETGVKVERVKNFSSRALGGSYGPGALLKVTRKYKDKNGTHTAVTYISTGEHLPLDMRNTSHRVSLLETLNRAVTSSGESNHVFTMEELDELGTDKLNALAHVLGLGVAGLSNSGSDTLKGVLTTDALLMLTGYVQLSDDASYFTLFHEYYHQMISFYKINGICTEEDTELLDSAFGSEEEAADAFAAYVTESDDGSLESAKLLAAGAGGDIDKLFEKFRRTADAFLAGGMAIDADGVPAFMKMMISGDFSNHSVARTSSEDVNLLQVEDMILNEVVPMPFGKYVRGSQLGVLARVDVKSAFDDVLAGTGTMEELSNALRRCVENDRIPVFSATKNPFGITVPPVTENENGEPSSPQRVLDQMTKIVSDAKKPLSARVSAFLHIALAKLQGEPDYPELARDMKLLGTSVCGISGVKNAVTSSRVADIARTIVDETLRIVAPGGSDVREFLGSSDALVRELALRIAHRLDDASFVESTEFSKGMFLHRIRTSKYRIGNYAELVGIVSNGGKEADAAIEMVVRRLMSETVLNEGSDADASRRTANLVRKTLPGIIHGLAKGAELSSVLPAQVMEKVNAAAEEDIPHVVSKGLAEYLGEGLEVPTGNDMFPPDGGLTRNFVDALRDTVDAAFAVREFVSDYGDADAPEPREPDDPDPIPPSSVPDVTPQLILMTPTSWLASDLLKKFNGVNLSDIMTDTSLQATTEETNRIANHLEFYFGLDLGIGDMPREIKTRTSRLGFSDDNLPQIADRHGHTVYETAAVRGYLMGLVNFDAKRTGEKFTKSDVDMADWAMQAAGAIAAGDDTVITGFDFAQSSANLIIGHMVDENEKPLAVESLVGEDGWYSPEAILNRVSGHASGFVEDDYRPTNLDIALQRILTRLPEDITGVRLKDGSFTVSDGLFQTIVQIASDVYSRGRGRGESYRSDSMFHEDLLGALSDFDLIVTSETDGRSVLSIPTDTIGEVWLNSKTVEKLVGAGRKKTLLDINYAAELIASDAARLHRAACKSKFLTDGFGQALSPVTRPGLWFEAGTGHYALAGQKYSNSYELFEGKVDIGGTIPAKYRGFLNTIVKHAKHTTRKSDDGEGDVVYSTVVRGYERAFRRLNDASDDNETRVSNRQLAHLMVMMGEGPARPTDSEIEAFELKIVSGQLEDRGVRPDMTVFEFDQFMYKMNCKSLLEESMKPGRTILSKPESEGGFGFSRQDFVNLQAILAKTGAELSADQALDTKMAGRINVISEREMFERFGQLGSNKTGTARLRAMAESVVHAERFRGCLAQMLTTVAPDGMPNYIVEPTDSAVNFLPDEVWGALAKFVITKMSIVKEDTTLAYDDSLSGVENMRMVADAAKKMIEKDEHNSDKSRKRTFNYTGLPPDSLCAGGIFKSIYVVNDNPDYDSDIRNRMVGGEAAGHLKQLFGALKSPTVWAGWKAVDRLMSYSKAASVGLSAFFAIATRIESPIAACGLWSTLMGQTEITSELARRLADSSIGEYLRLAKDMPYAADYAELMTSNDPALYQMRELMDLIGMPMSSGISNPVMENQGAIDSDIARMSQWLVASGHEKVAKELRDMAKMALHNPGEYAFSHILNSVKMAVVSQTMYRLRAECEAGNRPFDPVRELRKYSSYINAEIGGIQAEKYAWLTPTMQQVLRLAMFSYQWTLGAWTAGSGDIVTDLIFGGHHTTPAQRRNTFIRWLRMLGIVQVGVPVVLQAFIKGLATVLTKTGMVGDPDDPTDKDPLGIENMPWLCFNNESKIGMMSFDITPLLKLCGRIGNKVDQATESVVGVKGRRSISSAMPWITGVTGALLGYKMTGNLGGGAVGLWAGKSVGDLLPTYSGVGSESNRTGRKRFYMHFGKQGAEFFKWFYDAWGQALSKMSVPTQKVMEAFFGSGNGFEKAFNDMNITDRFFNAQFDPDHNAIVNMMTAFVPFSFNSLASKPDAGILGLFAPLQNGTSMTRSQKLIVKELKKFAKGNGTYDVWANPSNKKDLTLLCKRILDEAAFNGEDPAEVIKSGLATATHDLYVELFDALPKSKNGKVDSRKAAECLRALYRLNRKLTAVNQSLKKQYKEANVDWGSLKDAELKETVRTFMRSSYVDPWMDEDAIDDFFDQFFNSDPDQYLRSTEVQQDAKGGENFSNFLATDKVPETLFGIPIVSKPEQYTEEDLAFFREHPEAGGYYDLGDE